MSSQAQESAALQPIQMRNTGYACQQFSLSYLNEVAQVLYIVKLDSYITVP